MADKHEKLTHNHKNYEGRLDVVRHILSERFGLDDIQIETIAYDSKCAFKYNNFVYRVSLAEPIATSSKATNDGASPQPGTVAIPTGTKELIMRLANPNTDGMHPENRVENEVATISLASAALASFEPNVVPRVYGWGSAAGDSGQGWILQELLPGVALEDVLPQMDLQQKEHMFTQVAQMLKGLQEYQLPESITEFGGLTYDADGRIVSAPMPTVGAGPWPSYEASFSGRLAVALKKADENPHIKGWRDNGLRERIEAWIDRGLAVHFDTLVSKNEKSIIHADFTSSNILIDADSAQITGLIDYDFACILHPSYEFLRSFSNLGGQFRGWTSDEKGEEAILRDAKLKGKFPSPLPPTIKDSPVEWELAKLWEDAVVKADVQRPSTIKGIDKVADFDTVMRTILPWRLSNSDILRLQDEETILSCKKDNEKQMDETLARLGF
ncbi:kinase-like domain-containing protein [Bombardia bombarda]|uniref:non-specific serine/threonine protein kinase n=1 Tax=Bombardia bombarda TaxID=252184 RepID=A0AA39XN92_9PEZI|nr:kinase-like domain-containing protein [Bombardia bombarda]